MTAHGLSEPVVSCADVLCQGVFLGLNFGKIFYYFVLLKGRFDVQYHCQMMDRDIKRDILLEGCFNVFTLLVLIVY